MGWEGKEGTCVQFSSVAQSCLTLRPHEPQHARPPCPSPTPRVYPNSCPLTQWCHPTISSSIIPFSSCPQSFPASGSFQMSQLFASGGQSIRVSASTLVLPMNTQDWSPLGWTGWISLQSKGVSKTWGFMFIFSSGFVVKWKLKEFHPSVVCVLVWRNILVCLELELSYQWSVSWYEGMY